MIAFKIDENLHPDLASLVRRHGHDGATVGDQGLCGVSDEDLAGLCRMEGRALITLDLDFADIRAYPPEEYAGLIILRLSSQDRRHVMDAFAQIIPILEKEPLAGHLWVVDERSIRIRGKETEA